MVDIPSHNTRLEATVTVLTFGVSVSDARVSIAPASRLIAGAWTWRRMTSAEQQHAFGPLQDAFTMCSAWTDEAGMPRPSVPWLHPDKAPR